MQLSPRYDADPLIELQFPPEEILEPLVRQRSRFATRLSEFTDEQWATPSRCEGWSNRDVIVHLESTNAFWSHSIEHGVRGAPTRLLATFDPVATPAEMVAASADLGTAELLDRFSRSNQALIDLVMSLDEGDWAATAEAPPGHVSVSAVAHHALWDSWVHERDVLVPIGVDTEHRDDELVACLRYSAALGPSMAVVNGTSRPVAMRIDATDPATSFSVEVHHGVVVGPDSARADLEVVGGAAELIDAFSIRSPLSVPLPPEHAWIRAGLAEMFEVAAD